MEGKRTGGRANRRESEWRESEQEGKRTGGRANGGKANRREGRKEELPEPLVMNQKSDIMLK